MKSPDIVFKVSCALFGIVAIFLMLSIIGGIVTIMAYLLPVVAFVFWLLMLVDCLKNEPSVGNGKIVWVLVIVLMPGLGALLYFFIERPQLQRRT